MAAPIAGKKLCSEMTDSAPLSSTKSSACRPKWRKILYESQGVEDNYVDASFLDEMKKNLNTKTYDYWMVVYESGVITQQISSVILYIILFAYMNQGTLSPKMILYAGFCLLMIGYVLYDVIGGTSQSGRSRKEDAFTLMVFVSFTYGLSPVLMSLTESISTDTMYAMTTALMLVNLLFHDYTDTEGMVRCAVSLNAAIFASVCLASRLATSLHAFTTVTTAVLIFVLWPSLRSKVKRRVPGGHVTMTVVLSTSSAVLVYSLVPVLSFLLVILYLFITFICPAWLIYLQPYKSTIHGPWDEAEIKD